MPIAARDKGIVKVYDAVWDNNDGQMNEIFLNSFVRRYFLPYCFRKMYNDDDVTCGRPSWSSDIIDLYPYTYLPLNRRYKPIGITTDNWVEYDQYPMHFIRSKKPFFQINNVFTNRRGITKEETTFYLYNDGIDSRLNYFARLKHLMNYVVEADGR